MRHSRGIDRFLICCDVHSASSYVNRSTCKLPAWKFVLLYTTIFTCVNKILRVLPK
jgi:hypothetical protein